MKIIVTGGAGFIGSHVAETFLDAGHKVVIVDNLSRGKESNVPPAASFERLDITTDDLEGFLQKQKPDAVCHHAAQISVRDSVADPIDDLKTNIVGTVRLLDAAKSAGVKYFIFASTGGALYGDQTEFASNGGALLGNEIEFTTKEDHPTYPLSPYGISKLSAEKYLYFYRRQYGLKGAVLRYSNVYGPRQDPHGEAGVVAIFCRKALNGQTPTINGDGGQTRDYVYVKDVARANALTLQTMYEGELNIATGVETDVNMLARMIAKVAGSDIEFRHGPPMPGEQRRSVLNPGKALAAIGWKPEVSFEEGIGKTWEFFKKG